MKTQHLLPIVALPKPDLVAAKHHPSCFPSTISTIHHGERELNVRIYGVGMCQLLSHALSRVSGLSHMEKHRAVAA
jgi:hypothetical protein